jgi:hypothetical protein
MAKVTPKTPAIADAGVALGIYADRTLRFATDALDDVSRAVARMKATGNVDEISRDYLYRAELSVRSIIADFQAGPYRSREAIKAGPHWIEVGHAGGIELESIAYDRDQYSGTNPALEEDFFTVVRELLDQRRRIEELEGLRPRAAS